MNPLSLASQAAPRKKPKLNSVQFGAVKAAARQTVAMAGIPASSPEGQSLSSTLAKMGVRDFLPRPKALSSVMQTVDRAGSVSAPDRALIKDLLLVRQARKSGRGHEGLMSPNQASYMVDERDLLEAMTAVRNGEQTRLMQEVEPARQTAAQLRALASAGRLAAKAPGMKALTAPGMSRIQQLEQRFGADPNAFFDESLPALAGQTEEVDPFTAQEMLQRSRQGTKREKAPGKGFMEALTGTPEEIAQTEKWKADQRKAGDWRVAGWDLADAAAKKTTDLVKATTPLGLMAGQAVSSAGGFASAAEKVTQPWAPFWQQESRDAKGQIIPGREPAAHPARMAAQGVKAASDLAVALPGATLQDALSIPSNMGIVNDEGAPMKARNDAAIGLSLNALDVATGGLGVDTVKALVRGGRAARAGGGAFARMAGEGLEAGAESMMDAGSLATRQSSQKFAPKWLDRGATAIQAAERGAVVLRSFGYPEDKIENWVTHFARRTQEAQDAGRPAPDFTDLLEKARLKAPAGRTLDPMGQAKEAADAAFDAFVESGKDEFWAAGMKEQAYFAGLRAIEDGAQGEDIQRAALEAVDLDPDKVLYQIELTDAEKPRSITSLEPKRKDQVNRGFAESVQEKVLAATGGKPIDASRPEERETLARVLAHDAAYEMSSNPESNALGWYERKVAGAMKEASRVHKKIAQSEAHRGAYTYALAVTSNGMKVELNLAKADHVYRYWVQTGRMPDEGWGQAAEAMKKAFKWWNDGVKSQDDVMPFLRKMNTEFDPAQFRLLTGKPTTELAGEPVSYAQAIGPKIGGGFLRNLMGHFDALTTDRWMQRTWGRMTGNLVPDNPEQLQGLMARFQRESQSAPESIVGKYLKKDGTPWSKADLVDTEDYVDFANSVHKVYAKGDKTGTYVDKTELNKSGKNLDLYFTGTLDDPSPKDRANQRAVFDRVKQLLKEEHGIDITTADLQAVLWYPEQRLWGASENATDYERAAADYYRGQEGAGRPGRGSLVQPDYKVGSLDERDRLGLVRSRVLGESRRSVYGRTGAKAHGQLPSAYEIESNPKGADGLVKGPLDKQGKGSIALADGTFARVKLRPSTKEEDLGAMVRQVFKLDPSIKNQWALVRTVDGQPRISTPTMFEVDDPEAFHRMIQAGRASRLEEGASVHVYDPAEYAQMRLFLNSDGTAGFALKGDDIVSGFSHIKSKDKGAIHAMVQLGVDQGGRRLDCFDIGLPDIYSDCGFTTVKRMKWSDKDAPKDWNKEAFREFNNGEPDLIFMAYDPDSDARFVSAYGKNKGKVLASEYTDDYNAGGRAQKKALKGFPGPSFKKFVPEPKQGKNAADLGDDGEGLLDGATDPLYQEVKSAPGSGRYDLLENEGELYALLREIDSDMELQRLPQDYQGNPENYHPDENYFQEQLAEIYGKHRSGGSSSQDGLGKDIKKLLDSIPTFYSLSGLWAGQRARGALSRLIDAVNRSKAKEMPPAFPGQESVKGLPVKEVTSRSDWQTGRPAVILGYHGSDTLYAGAPGSRAAGALDKDLLGSNTGASSAKEGFFFAGRDETAQAYHSAPDDYWEGILAHSYHINNPELRQEARQAIADAMKLTGTDPEANLALAYLHNFPKGGPSAWEVGAWDSFVETVQEQLTNMMGSGKRAPSIDPKEGAAIQERLADVWDKLQEDNAMTWVPGSEFRGQFRLKMENPLVWDYNGKRYKDRGYTDVIKTAKANGHDGVILKNTYDGSRENPDDIFIILDPSQAENLKVGASSPPARVQHRASLDEIEKMASRPTPEVMRLLDDLGLTDQVGQPGFRQALEAASKDRMSLLPNDNGVQKVVWDTENKTGAYHSFKVGGIDSSPMGNRLFMDEKSLYSDWAKRIIKDSKGDPEAVSKLLAGLPAGTIKNLEPHLYGEGGLPRPAALEAPLTPKPAADPNGLPPITGTKVTGRDSFAKGITKNFEADDAEAESLTLLVEERGKAILKSQGIDPTPEAIDQWFDRSFKGLARAKDPDALTEGPLAFFATVDDKAIIGSLRSKSKASFIHETGHFFRKSLEETGQEHLWSRATRHYSPDSTSWSRKAEERFAKDWEQYTATGKAPTKALEKVFRAFSDWVQAFYSKLTGKKLAQALAPEVRGLFDEMLGADAAHLLPMDPGPGAGFVKKRAGEAYIPELGERVQLSGDEMSRYLAMKDRRRMAEDSLKGLRDSAKNLDEYKKWDEQIKALPARYTKELDDFVGQTEDVARQVDRKVMEEVDPFRWDEGEDPPMAARAEEFIDGDKDPFAEPMGPEIQSDPRVQEILAPAGAKKAGKAKKPAAQSPQNASQGASLQTGGASQTNASPAAPQTAGAGGGSTPPPTPPAGAAPPPPSAPGPITQAASRWAIGKKRFLDQLRSGNFGGAMAEAFGSATDIIRFTDKKGSKGRLAGEQIVRDVEKVLNTAAGRTVQALDAIESRIQKQYGRSWRWRPKVLAELEDMNRKIHEASVNGWNAPRNLNPSQTEVWKAWTRVNGILANEGANVGAMVDDLVNGSIGQGMSGQRVYWYGQDPSAQGTWKEMAGNVIGWAPDRIQVETAGGAQVWLARFQPFSRKSQVKPETYFPRAIKEEVKEALRAGEGEAYDQIMNLIALQMNGRIGRSQMRQPDLFDQVERLAGSLSAQDKADAVTAAKTVFGQLPSNINQAVGRAAGLERARMPWAFPDEFYDFSHTTAQHHVQASLLRIAKARVWGQDGMKLHDLILQMEDKGHIANVVSDVFGPDIAGSSGSKTLKEIVSIEGAWSTTTKLTGIGTTIKQLGQTGAGIGILGPKAMGKAAIELAKDFRQNWKTLKGIRLSGAVESDLMEIIAIDQASKAAGAVANVAMTVTGVKGVDKSLRYWTAQAGLVATDDAIQRLKVLANGEIKKDRHYRFLKEWVMFDDDAIRRLAGSRQMKGADKVMAYHAGAKTQVRVRSGDLPTFLTGHPLTRILARFQSFNFGQMKVLGFAVNEAKKGNLTPLMGMTAGYAAMGWVTDELLRSTMAWMEDKQKKEIPEELGWRLAYYVSQAGMLGLLGKSIEAASDPNELQDAEDDDQNYGWKWFKGQLGNVGKMNVPILSDVKAWTTAADEVMRGRSAPEAMGDALRRQIVPLNRVMKRGEPDLAYIDRLRKQVRQQWREDGISESVIKQMLDAYVPLPSERKSSAPRREWTSDWHDLMEAGVSTSEASDLVGPKPPIFGERKEKTPAVITAKDLKDKPQLRGALKADLEEKLGPEKLAAARREWDKFAASVKRQ
jgi:hypothetical protein